MYVACLAMLSEPRVSRDVAPTSRTIVLRAGGRRVHRHDRIRQLDFGGMAAGQRLQHLDFGRRMHTKRRSRSRILVHGRWRQPHNICRRCGRVAAARVAAGTLPVKIITSILWRRRQQPHHLPWLLLCNRVAQNVGPATPFSVDKVLLPTPSRCSPRKTRGVHTIVW